jgi:iron complex outermembrane receptor protein
LLTNVGTFENHGFEAALNFTAISTEKVTWDLGVNGTYNKGKITKLNTVKDENSVGVLVGGIAGATGKTIQIQSEGFAPNSFYVYKQVYDESGKPIEGLYADLNGDGTINDLDKYRYKTPEADVYLGFNSQVTYGNWNLGFVMRGSIGNYMYNNIHSNTGGYEVFQANGFLSNLSPSALESGFTIRQFESDYYIENASFLRMENINLGYNFGRILKDKVNLRVSANAQNVFVITKYSGLDPEIAGGIDNNFYPRPRVYSLGVNLDL